MATEIVRRVDPFAKSIPTFKKQLDNVSAQAVKDRGNAHSIRELAIEQNEQEAELGNLLTRIDAAVTALQTLFAELETLQVDQDQLEAALREVLMEDDFLTPAVEAALANDPTLLASINQILADQNLLRSRINDALEADQSGIIAEILTQIRDEGLVEEGVTQVIVDAPDVSTAVQTAITTYINSGEIETLVQGRIDTAVAAIDTTDTAAITSIAAEEARSQISAASVTINEDRNTRLAALERQRLESETDFDTFLNNPVTGQIPAFRQLLEDSEAAVATQIGEIESVEPLNARLRIVENQLRRIGVGVRNVVQISPTPPNPAIRGQLWYDDVRNFLFVRVAGGWAQV